MDIAIPSFGQFMLEENLIRQLLEEAKAGDLASFERLVILHERQVLRLAQRLLLNREAAKDAFQEVFLRLHRKLHTVDPHRNFTAWLYRATANYCAPRSGRVLNG